MHDLLCDGTSLFCFRFRRSRWRKLSAGWRKNERLTIKRTTLPQLPDDTSEALPVISKPSFVCPIHIRSGFLRAILITSLFQLTVEIIVIWEDSTMIKYRSVWKRPLDIRSDQAEVCCLPKSQLQKTCLFLRPDRFLPALAFRSVNKPLYSSFLLQDNTWRSTKWTLIKQTFSRFLNVSYILNVSTEKPSLHYRQNNSQNCAQPTHCRGSSPVITSENSLMPWQDMMRVQDPAEWARPRSHPAMHSQKIHYKLMPVF